MLIIVNILFLYLIIVIGIFGVFIVCNVACEYRNYSMGHRYVKAFKAQGNFQKMLIKFQSSKEIDSWDAGKITYIGYVYSMVCVATELIVVPFSLITVFINRDIAAWTYLYWFGGCFVLGICIFLIQVIDSILNFILEIFNK